MKNNNSIKDEDNFLDENGISLNNKIESEYNSSTPKALPFVIFENGKFIVPEEAKKLLSQKSFTNIGIISLVGKYRTGKSFLLNRVLLNKQENRGFGVGPTFRPCTKGIWIWSEPIIISNSNCSKPFPCFLIDTEGLGAYIEEINHDTKIFLIAVLISSLFIFNSFGAIDEISITSLSLILNLSETIKIKSLTHKDTEEELAEYFPALLWLLRDFSLKLEDINGNVITEKQYLEKALENVNGNNEVIQEKNRVRKLIRAYFPERDCFTMVRPVENEKDLQNLEFLPNEELRAEFLEQAENFRNKILKITCPKTFRKKLLNGSMLVELVQNILDSINAGCIPVIENTWKYVVQSECIKNTEDLYNKFSKEIRKFRDENKDDEDFGKKLKNFTKDLTKKYMDEFNNNDLFDDDIKKEYARKLKNKLNDELTHFDKENEGIFENKLNKDLDILSDKIINSVRNKNNNEIKFNTFFQELDLFKEKANQMGPDFAHKNDMILDKALLLAKKFIDEEKTKEKSVDINELTNLKNENIRQKMKINEYQDEIKNFILKNGNNLDNLNNELLELKLKLNNNEDKLKSIEKVRNKEKEKNEKEINDIIEDYELKIKKILNNKNNRDTEINMKNEQLNILKTNNEKIISLHEKKFQFYENEIKMLKEKIDQLLNISKNNESKLHSEIQNLKNINKSLKSEQNKLNDINDINTHKSINNSIAQLMNSINNHIKEQSDENKSIIDKLISEKEKEFKNDKELFQKLSEIKQKNKDLELKLNSTNYLIKELEDQINELNPYDNIGKNINNFQCKLCKKFFTLEEYKQHKNNCGENKSIKNNLNDNNYEDDFNTHLNPGKLRVRVLKGKIKNENLGRPYLEYILDINYSNTHHWRLGKKFSDFTKLYNTINSLYKEYITIPISNIFIDLNNSSSVGSFHENKIRQLEQFINDIIDTEIINISKPFIKFIEFEKHYDEDSDLLLGLSKSQKPHISNTMLKESVKNSQNNYIINSVNPNISHQNYDNNDENENNFFEE